MRTPSKTRASRLWVVVAVVAAPAVAAGQRTPDEEQASRLFRAGLEAFRADKYETAAQTFEAANDRIPSGAALFNAGRAWRQSGDVPRCLDAWERGLATRELTSEQETYVRRTMLELQGEAARLTIAGRGRVTVSHVRDRALPAVTWVAPGAHTIRVVRNDAPVFETTVRVSGGAERQVTVPGPALLPAEVTRVEDGPSSGRKSHLSTIGWSLTALAGGAAIAGGITGALAVDARDDFLDSGRLDVAARDRASNLQTASNVTWTVGACALVGGLGLLLGPLIFEGDADDRPSVPAEPRVLLNHHGLEVRF